MATVYLGLGSNKGDRRLFIRSALYLLEQNQVPIIKTSSLLETEPVGGPPQGKFLNAVVKAHTELPPKELLILAKAIESFLGREETEVNEPRPIDIDILLYDNLCLNHPRLTIPHPRMFDRDFVIKPLKEIAPEVIEHFQQAKVSS